jgi:DNA polymerase phi
MSRKRRQSLVNFDTSQAHSTPQKRRRQYTEEDSKQAELYENLASEIKDVRMKAAKDLTVKFSPENMPSAEAAQKALIRLVRGLCSNRKAARFGFFVALTEILRQLYNSGGETVSHSELGIDGVIDLVIERTQPEAKVSGQVSYLYLSLKDAALMWYVTRKKETT